MRRQLRISAAIALLSLAGALVAPARLEARGTRTTASLADVVATRHRTAKVDGVDIFYREAGPADAPVVVLLHGFPTSSRMFRNLIPALAGRYRVIAPDYPGFGHSAAPRGAKELYRFARYAELMDGLLAQLGATRYALYVQDYGAPVGFRLALLHPERVSALIVQNGNAYTDGLKGFWDPLRAYWADGSREHREALRAALTLEATRAQYVTGVRDASRVDPDSWVVDHALLARPGVDEIMLDLFYDYRENVKLYPRFHDLFRTRRPPTLIVWGRNDEIFHADGARAYLRDLPDAELHLIDSGHFALEDVGAEIARLMLDFLDRKLPRHPTR